MKVTLQKTGQQITLGQNDYIAGGGEGKVYGKGASAFKIYHDPNKMIPVGKIRELLLLTPKNVLSPKDIVLGARKKPVGFSMDLIPDSVFLTWLFNRGWKQQHGVTSDDLIRIVRRMRETTITLHAEKCVVGDYNEMQFLVAKDYSDVYFVDTDSYQTASYPCTAIMDTVRDRTVPFGTFSDGTDWFAYAVVTFQLWTGIHPYMCKHPAYTKKDAKSFKMMEDGVSAYSKDASLPKQALPLTSIPPDLSSWYKEVFTNDCRSLPPNPGSAVPISAIQRKKVMSTGHFNIEVLYDLDRNIRKVFVQNNYIYCVTDNAVYHGDRRLAHIAKNRDYSVVLADGTYRPILIKANGSMLEAYHMDGDSISSCYAENHFTYKSRLFSIHDGSVYSHKFSSMLGQIFHDQTEMDQLFGRRNILVCQGTVYQDVVGVPWFLIPNEDGSTQNLQVKELEGHRVLDAKYESTYLQVIAESKGDYYIVSFILKNNTLQFLSKEQCQPGNLANFTVLDKGVVVYVSEDDLALEMPLVGSKVVNNPPFDNSMPLYTDGSRVLVVNDNRLLYVSMV